MPRGEGFMNRWQACFRSVVLVLTAAMICVGCYPRTVGPPGPQGRPMTWPEMNFVQRQAHMRQEVLPRAAELFGEWRPQRFANVNCGLCHALEGENRNFNMPTSDLPRLSGALLLGPELQKHPETTRLKLNRLVPMMSEALGLKPFSVITRRGFGCYSCHLGPNSPVFGN